MTDRFQPLGRLKTRSEFLYVRDGVYRAIGGVVVQMRPRSPQAAPETLIHAQRQAQASIRIGFTATKKIGNAVTRNRAKRRLREAARTLLPEYGHPGCDYVLIARASTVHKNYTDLLADVKKALLSLPQISP